MPRQSRLRAAAIYGLVLTAYPVAARGIITTSVVHYDSRPAGAIDKLLKKLGRTGPLYGQFRAWASATSNHRNVLLPRDTSSSEATSSTSYQPVLVPVTTKTTLYVDNCGQVPTAVTTSGEKTVTVTIFTVPGECTSASPTPPPISTMTTTFTTCDDGLAYTSTTRELGGEMVIVANPSFCATQPNTLTTISTCVDGPAYTSTTSAFGVQTVVVGNPILCVTQPSTTGGTTSSTSSVEESRAVVTTSISATSDACTPTTATAVQKYTPCGSGSFASWCPASYSYTSTQTEYVDAKTVCPGPTATDTVAWYSSVEPDPTTSEVLSKRQLVWTGLNAAPTEDKIFTTKTRRVVVSLKGREKTYTATVVRTITASGTKTSAGQYPTELQSLIESAKRESAKKVLDLMTSARTTPSSSSAMPRAKDVFSSRLLKWNMTWTRKSTTSKPTSTQSSTSSARPKVKDVMSSRLSKWNKTRTRKSTTSKPMSTPSSTSRKITTRVNIVATSSTIAASAAPSSTIQPLDGSKPFRLITKVFLGDSRFDGLTIQNPADANSVSTPFLSTDVSKAAAFRYDMSTSSLALCCTKSNTTSGMTMIRDRDNDAYGPVHFGKEVGTALVSWACCDGFPDPTAVDATGAMSPIIWKNDRFGSWLVCQRPVSGLFELRWWDIVTNQGIDTDACAKVQLLAVNIKDSDNHQDC